MIFNISLMMYSYTAILCMFILLLSKLLPPLNIKYVVFLVRAFVKVSYSVIVQAGVYLVLLVLWIYQSNQIM